MYVGLSIPDYLCRIFTVETALRLILYMTFRGRIQTLDSRWRQILSNEDYTACSVNVTANLRRYEASLGGGSAN